MAEKFGDLHFEIEWRTRRILHILDRMRAFVTGATGLLGNNLVRALRARGHDVVGLVRSDAKARQLLGDTDASWIVGDVREPSRFAQALEQRDVFFHTAAYFRESYQPGDHADALADVNVRGTLALLALADERGLRKFVHVGAGGIIGTKADGQPGDEDTQPPTFALENPYFKSKVEGDAKVRSFVPKNGLEVVEILPGWMWGPGDAGPTGSGQLAKDFLSRKLPGIPPGGANVVDARDVANAMIAAAEKAPHGSRYIVAGPSMTLGDVIATLERVSGVHGPFMRIPYPVALGFAAVSETWARMTGKPTLITRDGVKTMHANIRISSARAERELGVTFRQFEQTARDVLGWYTTHDSSFKHAPAAAP
jgi:dihydroflavonol-4-reductase